MIRDRVFRIVEGLGLSDSFEKSSSNRGAFASISLSLRGGWQPVTDEYLERFHRATQIAVCYQSVKDLIRAIFASTLGSCNLLC